jgi:hypothetical protein
MTKRIRSEHDPLRPETQFLISLCRRWMQITALCSGLLLTCVPMLWSQAADADEFSPQEWAIIKTLSPLPDLPADTNNEYRILPPRPDSGKNSSSSRVFPVLFRQARPLTGSSAPSVEIQDRLP